MRCLIIAALALMLSLPVAAQDFEKGREAYQRDDYATALQEWRPLAERGHADAQYLVGIMYALGQGAPQDYVKAHMWFNLAAAQGDKEAATKRDIVAKPMIPDQIAKAERLAREWLEKHGMAQYMPSRPKLSGEDYCFETQQRHRETGEFRHNDERECPLIFGHAPSTRYKSALPSRFSCPTVSTGSR